MRSGLGGTSLMGGFPFDKTREGLSGGPSLVLQRFCLLEWLGAQRVQKLVYGRSQVESLVLRALFLERSGGVEETVSLCRGEGEKVRMFGWLQ